MQVLVHTPTPDLQVSIDYYKNLGFKMIKELSPTLLADNQCVIEINSDRFARPGLRLVKDSWDEEIAQLSNFTKVINQDKCSIVQAPCGTRVYLDSNSDLYRVPTTTLKSSHLGVFKGLCLEVVDVELSVKFWRTLGFTEQIGDANQGWVQLNAKSGFGICIMIQNSCPHLFINPSLTYFNGGKNLDVIKTINKLRLPIVEEVTHFTPDKPCENIIIQDPGGYGCFLFND